MSELSSWNVAIDPQRLDDIERQHDRLLALIDVVLQRDAEHAPKQELSEVLQELCRSTEQHFADEEQYMRATGYSKLDTHQLVHRQLLTKLREHVDLFESGQQRLGKHISSFLKFWLCPHITGQDREARTSILRHPRDGGTANAFSSPRSGTRPGNDRLA